jgi:arylsulfatase
MEGESVMRAVKGQKQRSKPIFWEHEGNRAVREGDWKLVSRYPGDWELYNIAQDRTEMSNLAAKDSARATRMKGMYDQWASRCGVVEWGQLQKRS